MILVPLPHHARAVHHIAAEFGEAVGIEDTEGKTEVFFPRVPRGLVRNAAYVISRASHNLSVALFVLEEGGSRYAPRYTCLPLGGPTEAGEWFQLGHRVLELSPWRDAGFLLAIQARSRLSEFKVVAHAVTPRGRLEAVAVVGSFEFNARTDSSPIFLGDELGNAYVYGRLGAEGGALHAFRPVESDPISFEATGADGLFDPENSASLDAFDGTVAFSTSVSGVQSVTLSTPPRSSTHPVPSRASLGPVRVFRRDATAYVCDGCVVIRYLNSDASQKITLPLWARPEHVFVDRTKTKHGIAVSARREGRLAWSAAYYAFPATS